MSPQLTNGEEIMVWVKAKVNPKLYLKVPGLIIAIWGHDFEVQKDGSLCMQMHPDFVDTEVKANRIEIMKDPPFEKDNKAAERVTIIQPNIPVGFTLDIGNYYGVGDLNKLIDKVTKLKKTEIIAFAAERFPRRKKLDERKKKDDLIDKIRSFIDSELIKLKEAD